MKSRVAALLIACAFVFAQDSVTELARILASKGTITQAELAQVERASDRTRALTDILQRKGVINATEAARVAPSTTAVAQSATQAPAQTTAATTGAPPATSQSRFPLKFYGTLLVNSAYDTAAMNITDIPLFTSKQGSNVAGDDKAFAMTGRQTRFGVDWESDREVAGAKFEGKLEMDFLGGKAPFGNGVDMDLLRLRLAYGRLNWSNVSLEAGQDWALFAPLNPTSYAEYAIPSMSAAGNPWIRLPQVRAEVHGDIADNVKLLAQFAALDPNMGDYSTATFSAARPPGVGERGRAPAVEARFALTSKHDDRDFALGFSGHYAHGKNSGPVDGITEQLSLDSWGAAIDYKLPFTKFFNLSGEAYTGRALGIFSVTSGEAIQPVGVFGDRGVRSSGGWAQAQFDFTKKLQVNLAYGIDSPDVRDIAIGSRTRNQNYMANVVYKYTQHILMAWEFRRLLTDFRNQPFANERGATANLAFGYIF